MQGKTINGFTLQRRLGTGGMAEVWYAENEIRKATAVKILNAELSNNVQIVERFRNEAEIMVKLNHPNIRQVYGYGSIDSRPAIIMEYLEGGDLKARLKRGQRFTDEELKRWWNQLVSALNYTHGKGIVHRDIKPGNIFVDVEGNIKLLDFGIAKVRESISSTQTGQKLGTLMYMSPEQVKDSKHIDYRTDVYSLAVTFVHLITGKRPYDSDQSSDFEISEQIVYKPLDLSAVPESWRGFLRPCLEKDPEKRPALRPFEVVSGNPSVDSDDDATFADTPVASFKSDVGSKKDTPTPSGKSKSKKNLWMSMGALAVVALLLALLFIPKEEPTPIDPDTQAFQACRTVDDYRAYIRDYGRNALHYADAMAVVDQYIADSTAKAQQLLAEQQAQQQAEAEAQAKAEAEKKEDAAFRKCTTIAACNSYLKAYPKGRYVEEVKAKKAELEEKEKQNNQGGNQGQPTTGNNSGSNSDGGTQVVPTPEPVIDNEIYSIVEEMPSFPGGDPKMYQFIKEHLNYPQAAKDKGVTGRVFVSFIVEPDGSLTNVKVIRGIGSGCDEEAMRVVKSMPKWKPGKQKGNVVRVSYQLPVSFKM